VVGTVLELRNRDLLEIDGDSNLKIRKRGVYVWNKRKYGNGRKSESCQVHGIKNGRMSPRTGKYLSLFD
jgi:hypothetical protein